MNAPGGGTELDTEAERAIGEWAGHMEAMRLHAALESVMTIVRKSNAWVDARAPWTLAKDPDAAAELDGVLGALIRSLARAAGALQPFMPEKSSELWRRLGGEGSPPHPDELGARWPVRLPEDGTGVLFPRIESPPS